MSEREELVKRLIEMRGRLARGVFEYRLGDQFDGDFQNLDDAIAALSAQPQQEPVAWMQTVENPGEPKRFLLSMECENSLHRQIKHGGTYQRKPLYTAPPSGVREVDAEQTHVRVPVDKLTISDCYRFGIDISSIRSTATATGKESEHGK